MVMRLLKREGKKRFVSIATAQHNAQIERVVYSSPKVTKPLFFIGAVLPDFKISWVMLLVYVVVKYPLSMRIVIRNALRELKTDLYLLKRGYK